MAEAFENCSLGMMSLMLDPGKVRPRQRVGLSAQGRDWKSLLVSWLSEVLYRVEAENLAFASFKISRLTEYAAAGWGMGEPLDRERHAAGTEIKAPTYHMLVLEEIEGLWTAQVIFDV
jgi:SHS2 domain-containing protein